MSWIVKVGKQGKKIVKKLITPAEKHYVGYTRRIERVHTTRRICAMTFDDGPMGLPASPDRFDGRTLTDVLLDTLAQYGARELAASASAQTDGEIEQFIRQYADTIYHPVGSCRMGPGPLDVVDAQLRVHGVHGLRVVDASVMPRIVSGNTNAPTIMLAEKAVDLLRGHR